MRRFDSPRRIWHLLLVLASGPLLLGNNASTDVSSAKVPTSPTATDTTARGIVWTPPASPDSAVRELEQIHALGATAVRLTRLPADTVAARADSLGLELYVDLPVDYMPAPRVQDSLRETVPELKQLQTLAERHASVTHVGLAHGVDTTVPRVCDRLRRWTNRVRAEPPSLRTYYVTPFTPSADRCDDAVDRVLLDLRGHPDPVGQWRAWHDRTDSVSIGALGTWSRPGAAPGLRAPHSEHRQARYLEDALPHLLDSTQTAPAAVFVARWRNIASSPLPSRQYGIHDAAGAPRPAARVVQGIYSGTQRTFAFPEGSTPPNSYGLVAFGWGLVALLGLLYASNLVVRQTVVRYFTAPGFYRDALRDGREAFPGANGLLLGVAAGSVGVAFARAAQMAAAQHETEHVLAALPRTLQSVLVYGIEHPTVAGVVAGGSMLAGLLLWMGVLMAAARVGTRFSLGQGLMLVTWPCWPTLLAPLIALAAGADAPLSLDLFGLFLLGGGALVLVSLTLRVLYDYWQVTNSPAWTLLPLVALSPIAVVGICLLIAGEYGVSFSFLWHLGVYP